MWQDEVSHLSMLDQKSGGKREEMREKEREKKREKKRRGVRSSSSL